VNDHGSVDARVEGDPARAREVLAVERAWVEAHRALDLQVLADIMADDYTAVQPDGRVIGKAEELASYASGTRHWDLADSDQYHLRVGTDTAVLVGRWRGRGVNGDVHFDYWARFTAIFALREERWRLIHAQSTDLG
jgi:ketosteroid isomerase-like protein